MSRRELWIPSLLLLLAAAVRLLFFSGLYGHDDWVYLFYIRSFHNGQSAELLNSLWGLRFPIWVPVSTLFDYFGASYLAAFLPGFLLGLATVPLAYCILRKLGFSLGIAALGCVFLIVNPIDWLVSTTLRGDIEMSFYGGALFLLLLCLHQAQGRRKIYWAVIGGLVWGLSCLTKEWGYVFAWGMAAILVTEIITTRKIPWEYTAIALGFFIILALDSLLLRLLTGDWLARVHTSISWYQNAADRGEYIADDSTRYRYLVDLFAGLKTSLTTSGQFTNRYPYYGPYMWLLLVALPFVLIVKGAARSAAIFILGILLWIEFGSMSWHHYLPYHKEPRYFSLISVPAAVVMAAACSLIFSYGLPRIFKSISAVLIGAFLIVAVQVGVTNYHDYTDSRDFMPGVVTWLENNPSDRLWMSGTIQNELDLRFGYRFSDPVHQHAGQPGFGSIMDVSFWEQRKPGDLLLVHTDWKEFNSMFPQVDRRNLKLISTLPGQYSTARLYRFQPRTKGDGSYFLSDEDPIRETHSFGGPRWDLSFDGAPIHLNGIHYPKGIGAHSHSEITYRIDPGHPVFTAFAALDDARVHSPGSVVFIVYADYKLMYRSPVMRWNSPVESIRLDLAGASELKLVIEDAGDGDVSDHGTWAQPLMSAAEPHLLSTVPIN